MRFCREINIQVTAWCGFVAGLCLLGTPAARAQMIPSSTEGSIVKEIMVQYLGPATVDRGRILANMRTKVGSPYSQAKVEEDIKGLVATGEIENVRIYTEPKGGGLKVTVMVQTRASVSDVQFLGQFEVLGPQAQEEGRLQDG